MVYKNLDLNRNVQLGVVLTQTISRFEQSENTNSASIRSFMNTRFDLFIEIKTYVTKIKLVQNQIKGLIYFRMRRKACLISIEKIFKECRKPLV